MTADCEAIVVGLGIAGASALHALARRGVACVGLEAREAGHGQGSSHGHSRITRTAVGEGAAYVPLVQRSEAIWRDLAAKGHDLRRDTGVLYLQEPGAGARMHGSDGFLSLTAGVGAEAGVALERLDAAAIRARWPMFLVPDGTTALFEAGAGVLRPEACVAALLAEAAALGAVVQHETPVLGVARGGGKVVVETAAGRYRADRVILAMGAWTPGGVGDRFAEHMQVLAQVQYWFRADPVWQASPAYIWFHGAGAEDNFYGFPMLEPGVIKVATEQYGVTCDPDTVDREVPAGAAEEMFRRHVEGRLAGVSGECVEAMTCLYTHNADPAAPGRFRVGPHPSVDGVTVISACSGHGFKHAAGLGEAVVGDLFGDAPFCDLGVFA
jgi:sarcosine oxidase